MLAAVIIGRFRQGCELFDCYLTSLKSLGGDNGFARFTVPTLKAFLKAYSQNVSGNKQKLEFVAHATGCPKTHFAHALAIFQSAEK